MSLFQSQREFETLRDKKTLVFWSSRGRLAAEKHAGRTDETEERRKQRARDLYND